MAENLFDKASYSLIRTNPKLTGNVKVVSDGTDIYLESFSANTRLSSQRYKAFKVDGTNTYDEDVFRFFNSGKFPKEAAYEVFQEFENTSVLSSYGNQYEMFYSAGTRSVASESYSQSLGTLAPLWLNEQIPNYFVIFRLDNPAAVNNINAATENAGTANAQTSVNFSKQVLENCTAIKTFDLSEGTKLGSYIRNYRNQEEFPEVPLNISWRKDEPILWNGISYNSGGFTSSGSYSYSDLIGKDATIMENEYFFTQGFQNNGILLANLLNLEFLFDDPKAPDYSLNRYFGMYVNEIEEGSFDLSGIGFFKNTEKTQLPKIKTITEVSQFLNTSFEITNEEGILLFLDPTKTTTITGLPTPNRVNEVESIFYVKDKEDDFHTIKKGSKWGTDQLRLFDKKIDISLLTGYKEPDTYANATILSRQGLAQMSMKVVGNPTETPAGPGSALAGVGPWPIPAGQQTVSAGNTVQLYSPSGNVLIGATLSSISSSNIIPVDTFIESVSYDYSGLTASPSYPVILNITLNNDVTLDNNSAIQFASPTPIVEHIPNGSTIYFYDGVYLTGFITANTALAPTPGKSTQNFFNPTGTVQEVAQAITTAINKGINENDRFFEASYNDDTVYVICRNGGSRFNQLSFKLDVTYPTQFDSLQSHPLATLTSPKQNFIGGNDTKNALLRVKNGSQKRFVKGNFVQTTGGYAEIGDWVPYTDEPIYDNFNNQIGYKNIDTYAIITCNDNQIEVSRSNQVALYSDYKPSFGRFSFFDVRDFDVDFYSTLYSEEGELVFEKAQYNQSVPGLSGPDYIGISSTPEIRKFYDTGGFFNLVGLLKPSSPEDVVQDYIASEYIRLEENFLTSQAAISRVIPYINKWSWINDGKDVRNHPYRLDLSEAFGLNNFAPSKWDRGQVASGYTHEWYYLSEFPTYFTQDAIKSSWSYIDKAPNDDIPADPLTGQVYVPGTFQRVDKNYFNDYFIVQRFTTGGVTEIDRQLRYGRFKGGDDKNFAETFLRGVRIIAKPKAIGTQKPDFDNASLSYVTNGEFNEYRFSAVLVPNLPDKPETEIKFIKNDKWKTVVMLISVKFDDPCLNGGAEIIDRTSLYSMESKYKVDSNCAPVTPIQYLDSTLQGAIRFDNAQVVGSFYQINGIPDVNGNPTRFLDDLTIGLDGSFPTIEFEDGGATYQISNIQEIVSQSSLIAATVTRNGANWVLPNITPSTYQLIRANYKILQGGFNAYQNRLNQVGFAEIFEAVNMGNPNIVYQTIDKDGNQVLNSDGSLSQTFSIELRAQEDILKAVYVGVLPDPNKPTAFNLTDVIGYDLSLQKAPRLTPIGRHAGYYQPTALSILSFRDPYMNIDFNSGGGTGSSTGSSTGGSIINDEAYKLKVLELCKYKNTQFFSSDSNFGQLKNFFYHKVNEQDPSTILELSAESAFPSLYPLINEWAIDYKDFYAFSSNWEPSYFIKTIDKTLIEDVIGTRSMKEKKSFFGSKSLKVPEKIILETFTPDPFVKAAIKQPSLIDGTFMYQDTPSVTFNQRQVNTVNGRSIQAIKKKPSAPTVSFYIFNQKRLIEYLFPPIKEQFEKYIKDLYGWGNLETLDDDVNRYIEENILKLYKIERIDFYTLASRDDQPDTYSTAQLTNEEKITAGLTINENVSSKTLNTNPFDLRLIYNKRTGFSESYGFSVTIVKK